MQQILIPCDDAYGQIDYRCWVKFGYTVEWYMIYVAVPK